MTEVFIHKRGGGTVVGVTGAIGSDCYLDRLSRMEGRSFVSCSTSISNSSLLDSTISDSEIEDSAMISSHIAGAIVNSSALSEVVIRGNSRRAIVEGSILSNHVVVEGCRVRGVHLEGPYLLHSDHDKTPRHFLLTEGGVHLGLVECFCQPGVLSCVIGCKCRPVSVWIERKELLRRAFAKRGWQGQVDIIHELFKEWQS